MDYNKLQPQGSYIIARFMELSIDEHDESHKTKCINLVVFTMIFGFYTLGCKVNQYETQAMEQLLTQMGHAVGSFEEKCDCNRKV